MAGRLLRICMNTDSAISHTARRLGVIHDHVRVSKRHCSEQTENVKNPTIAVNPLHGMVDETVHISLKGFPAQQNVTLVASLIENNVHFESRCVYKTDDDGCADNFSSESAGGTFCGIEPMGLFWSLQSDPQVRLIKRDVHTPMIFNIKAFQGIHIENKLPQKPATEIQVHRLFKKHGVKSIPLPGKFQGTVFIPEGEGPFPTLLDLYGGIVSLVETRAAMLASHGYVTMALCYLYRPDLPQSLKEVDLHYIQDAIHWLLEQDYVDEKRFGSVGLCFGGTVTLKLTSLLPQIRAMINVNGFCVGPSEHIKFPGFLTTTDTEWPDQSKVFHTEEGFDITNVYDCENAVPIPAWQHGAKVLIIVGEDDKQVHPKWHSYFYEKCPDIYKSNIQLYHYPGAGHLIEPPHTPHVRNIVPGKKRLEKIFFIPEKYHDTPMMSGGWTATHAHAQEDSWKKILKFLEDNVKNI
ncbi:hypothetical protein ACF0H5_002561 [Mactra antiquata]